jgi:hypothetical protein
VFPPVPEKHVLSRQNIGTAYGLSKGTVRSRTAETARARTITRSCAPMSLANEPSTTKPRIGTAAIISLVICAAAGSLTWAQGPAALVLEHSGTSTPNLAPYSEVMEGAVVKLGLGARLVFVDYFNCNRVTVNGAGMVRFTAQGSSVGGAAKKTAVRVPCPREIVIKNGGESSAMVLRGGEEDSLALSIRPDFVLVGGRAGDFTEVRFSKGTENVLEGALTGRRFSWPPNAPALADGCVYELILLPKGSGAQPIKMSFRAAALLSDQHEQQVLIRVD